MQNLVTDDQHFRFNVCADPFSSQRKELVLSPGMTIKEMLDHVNVAGHIYVGVYVNGTEIPMDLWGIAKPKAGTLVTCRAIPMGGDDSNPIAVVLTIALAVAAPWAATAILPATASAFAIAATTAVISIAGGLLINAIAPPPKPRLGTTGDQTKDAQVFGISGIRNTLPTPAQPVLCLFGKHKVFPFFAAKPYTEITGGKMFLNALFDFGYGPINFSSFKIGTIPLENYDGVDMEIRQGYDTDAAMTLYRNSVDQQPLSVNLKQESGWRTFETDDNTNEAVIDLLFQGLIGFDDQGNKLTQSVSFNVEYRLKGTSTWLTDDVIAPNGSTTSVPGGIFGSGFTSWSFPVGYGYLPNPGLITISDKTSEAKFAAIRIPFSSPGRYKVRIKRNTADSTDTKIRNESTVSSLKSITYKSPVNASGRAMVALRIQATDQLNGVVDTFNAVCERMLPIWNGSSWTAPAVTRNPAWAYAWALNGAANMKPVADSKLDLNQLKAWADDCDTRGYKLDAVVDGRSTLDEILRDIASAGRAGRDIRDGTLFSVIMDRAQTVVADIVTPREITSFRGRKLFAERPHGIKARYRDETEDWDIREIVIYDEGYHSGNATLFEVMELWGKTTREEVHKFVKFHLASVKLRPEEFEIGLDIRHIAWRRGDYVVLSHDVPLIGLSPGWGRVKSFNVNGGGDVTDITIDEQITFEAGKSYTTRIRLAEGTQLVEALSTSVETTSTLTFSSAVSMDTSLLTSALVTIGESGKEELDCIVKSIRAFNDLTARVVLAPLANAIHDADTGAVPAYDPKITTPPEFILPTVPRPIISNVISDETVLLRTTGGNLINRIAVSLTPPDGFDLTTSVIRAQIRDIDSTDFSELSLLPASSLTVYFLGVTSKDSYEIRIRYETNDSNYPGLFSEWATIQHTAVGKSTPPPDVSNFYINKNLLTWSYPNSPVDVQFGGGFRIKYHDGTNTNWNNAIPLHEDTISVQPFDIGNIGFGTKTIMIKAVDSEGNESAGPAIIFINLGDIVTKNIILTEDLDANNFPGTVTNGTIISGDIKADDSGGLFWTGDTEPFWTNDNALYWTDTYLEMGYEFTFTPSPDLLDATLFIEHNSTGEMVKLLYHSDSRSAFWDDDTSQPFWDNDNDPFWSGAVPAFAPWPGSLSPLIQHKYTFKVVTAAGYTRGVIDQLAIKLDVPDIQETLEDQTIGISGSTINLSNDYRDISNIAYNIQDDGGDAVVVRFSKNATENTVTGKAYDKDNTLTTANIDMTIRGY